MSILRVEGRVCAPVGAELAQLVQTLLRGGERRIVLDLAAVPDLDAAGAGELVSMFNMAAAAHAAFHVSHPSKRVRKLLDRARLLELLTDPMT